jgi:hypothetical protein
VILDIPRPSILYSEEDWMTIQVAMHGSDGILLAGDTQQRDPLKLRGQYLAGGAGRTQQH